VFAVIEGPQAGWLSGEILTLFVVAGAALAAFIFCELRSADPMMDLNLFRDRTYSLAIIAMFAKLFGTYGMLLVITQYLQNVRGFSPMDAGLLLLPYSVSVTIVSLIAGKLVGVVGSRPLILLGLALQVVGFAVLIAWLPASMVAVITGLVFAGASILCMTPITSLAMTAVPAERAGMASGIMAVQRALGSSVGFAVLGSILAAVLTATLNTHLAGALPDSTERKEVVATIIGNANPRAYSAEIGPARPIQHLDGATQKAILAAADSDFVAGIRFSLATAMVFVAVVLAAGFAWFPRGKGAIADAEREAKAIGSEETARESHLS
jgi:MFS family permease